MLSGAATLREEAAPREGIVMGDYISACAGIRYRGGPALLGLEAQSNGVARGQTCYRSNLGTSIAI